MRLVLMTTLTLILSLAGLPVTPENERPRLLGVARITVRASDPDRSAIFYRDLLGFAEITPRSAQNGSSRLFRINDRQSVEVVAGLQPTQDRLVSVSLQTDRVELMRRYLGGRGWKVPASPVSNRYAQRSITVADPEGRLLEFVELPIDGSKVAGKRIAPKDSFQISQRMMHAGIIVTGVPSALDFYTGLLGLREFWRGSGRDSQYLSWINMRLPESEDYLELMLYGEEPAGDRRGSAHHLCLEVADIDAARARLEANPARAGYTRPIEIRVGVNRRRQLNLFDPDGTRSELMEPRTIDGVPPVSSTLPYPPR